MCKACVLHDRGDVREVQVDEARHGDQLGDIGNRLTEHAVRDFERVLKGDLLLGYVLEALVRDDDQRVNVLVELVDAAQRLLEALLALERERTGDNADRQDAHLAGDLRHDRSRARAGAAAHAGGDEYHVGVLQRRSDLVLALLRCLAADLRVCARALALGQLFADLDLGAGLREIQRLHIRVDRNKFNALHAALDHAVDRIAAAAADADDFDINYIIQALFKLKTHCCHPPFYDKESFRLSFTFFVGVFRRLPRAICPHCFNFTSISSILQHKLANSSKKYWESGALSAKEPPDTRYKKPSGALFTAFSSLSP